MSRVMKRFIRKIAEPISFALYFFGTLMLAEYLGSVYGLNAFMATMVVMIIVPVFAWLIKETYLQAKREVDFENEQLLRDLGK